MKNKIVCAFLIICTLLVFIVIVMIAREYFYLLSMKKAIADAGALSPSSDYIAVFHSSVDDDQYSVLNNLIEKIIEKKDGYNVKRLFCGLDETFYCVATKKVNGNRKIYLLSVDTNTKSYKTIKEYDNLPMSEFGDIHDSNKNDFSYSSLNAFYFNEKIYINAVDKVYEYDVKSGEETVLDAKDFNYPEVKTRLAINNDDSLQIESETGIDEMSFEEILASSKEMRYLYELTKKEENASVSKRRFLCSITYYDTDPYIIVQHMDKLGNYFGALFRFIPDNRSFVYINCYYTFDYPNCLYPIIVLSNDYDLNNPSAFWKRADGWSLEEIVPDKYEGYNMGKFILKSDE